MRAAFSFGKNRGSCRFYCYDLNIRVLLFQVFSCSCKCSACADTSYEDVYLSVCILPNLRTCSSFMCSRVCRIYKLSRDIAVRDFFSKFICFGDCTFHSLGSFCQNQFCAICFQNISTLNTHGLRHGKDDSVSFRCCDRCKTDTCVSGCWLDDYRFFFKDSLCFSVLDHRFGDSVFYTSCRIEIFQFHKYCSFQSKFLLYICYFYKWSVSDQSKCSFINVCHGVYRLSFYLFIRVCFLLTYLFDMFSMLFLFTRNVNRFLEKI